MPKNTPPTETHVPDHLRRVVVVGSSGSGKTTLARKLSELLGVTHVELDGIRHGPNWAETPDPIFRERVAEATAGDRWVVDGNYSVARDILWPRATTVLYLDYSISVVMRRLIVRTLRRGVMREVLWNGNTENILENLNVFSDNSAIGWSLKNHWRRRRQFNALFQHPDYAHVEILRFHDPRAVEEWLGALAQLTAKHNSSR